MNKDNIFDYIEILRPGHWFKNIVVIFGTIAAIFYFKANPNLIIAIAKTILAFFLACIVSSVNYAVNNICDEKNDTFHPVKKNRALPSKKLSKGLILVVICFLLLSCMILAKIIYGNMVVMALFSLFLAGIFYNVKPLRFKDIPFLDVISESVNNPIRILIGWFAISEIKILPPISFLFLFWSLGAIMMSAKRYAELKYLLNYNGKVLPHLYRNSYKIYSLKNIFIMVLFYTFLSVFLLTFLSIKFRTKLLLSLPIVVLYFRWLLLIMEKDNSPFREPEKIFFKNKYFSIITLLVIILMFLLFLVRL